jgi:hypothetical protein
LQIEIVVLALALIISTEETEWNGKDVNSQMIKENSTREQVVEKIDELSVQKDEEKQKERNEFADNEESIFKQKGRVSEFEGHQDDEGSAKAEKRNQGERVHDEEDRKSQNTGNEYHLHVNTKHTQGEGKASELQHDVKGTDKVENDEELKEKKHTNPDGSILEQADNSSSVGEHSDQQTAQNNGLEVREKDNHLGGYRVTEPEQEEAHHTASHKGFNFLLSKHRGHSSQYHPSTFGGATLHKSHEAQTFTLPDEDSVQHFPVYIADEQDIPHPVQKAVSYPVRQYVSLPATVPLTVHKPARFHVQRPYFLPVPVPQPYTAHAHRLHTAPYSPYHVNIPVPVKVPVHRPVSVTAQQQYPLPVQGQDHSPVQKELLYPVQVRNIFQLVRFEVSTAVTMKNGVFGDATPCGSCKDRRFGGT